MKITRATYFIHQTSDASADCPIAGHNGIQVPRLPEEKMADVFADKVRSNPGVGASPPTSCAPVTPATLELPKAAR